MRSLSLNRSVLFPLIFLSSCFFQLSVTDWRCKVAAEGHIKAARGSDSSSSHGRLQTPERGRTLMKRVLHHFSLLESLPAHSQQIEISSQLRVEPHRSKSTAQRKHGHTDMFDFCFCGPFLRWNFIRIITTTLTSRRFYIIVW